MPPKLFSRRFLFVLISIFALNNLAPASTPLSPLLAAGKPVDWWFVFKFNAHTFRSDATLEPTPTLFGGTPTNYPNPFSLNYAYASSADPTLRMATNYIGVSLDDPLGATFDQIYHGTCNYVLWNDQFHKDPIPDGDSQSGHSKGALAWDDNGDGFVLQVSTPSWPASGSAQHPRKDGNTLGTVHDNDVEVSQHFFALKLNAKDVANVLMGLANASVVTKTNNLQIFHAGGPTNLIALAQQLGKKSPSTSVMKQALSTAGVIFISKPSQLHVPAWQLVSAKLDGLPIRAATWWQKPEIPTTTATTPIGCWDTTLGQPGLVQIATSGSWQGNPIGLQGGPHPDGNHAKIGVSLDSNKEFCIFGDMNQQGNLDPDCSKSQNGRGGTFYVLKQPALFQSLTALLAGGSAPVQ